MTTLTSRPPSAVELLERAIAYTRGALLEVREEDLGNETPCAGWTLLDLLHHMDDSLQAMAEAASAPVLSLTPAASLPTGRELLDRICARACALLGHWNPPPRGQVGVGDLFLSRELLGSVGALEITVHGWDVAQATGHARPIPPGLAMDLWPVARDTITDMDRPVRFGPVLDVPSWASPQERLLAHLGRR